MNRNVVHQSSPVQQMMAAGGPNWWNSNNMRPASSPPFPPQHSSPFLVHPPPGMILPQHISSWNDNQEFPDQSWSQLLMGGITNGEDKSHMQEQDKKLEIWEEAQLLQQQASNGSNSSSIKQENSTNNYHLYASTTSHGYNINAEFQQTNSAAAKPSYSQLLNNIPPVISSPTISCVTSLSSNMLDFSNNKLDGKHPPPDRSSDQCNSTGAGGVAKKARVQPSSSTQSSTFKVRKEKLGDRITTLHQLVSPFGKTDTASVLLEALGYIRFLQSQIEALSLPYLGNGRSGNSMRQQQSETNIEEGKKDLRSKGLCLVPISCTIQVGSDNGADYWAPAAAAFGGSF